MRYYLIVGEASGDMHAANLMREIANADCEFVFRCHGGDLMKEAGGEIVRHYKDTAVMGFITVLKNIGKIKRNLDFVKADIEEWQPDVLILIDFPGFNLKIAEFTKSIGIKNYYYISPKIWAWKKWRIKSIKKYIDKMFCIFPFEVDFYKEYDYPVFYAGNPLLDSIERVLDREQTREDFLKINDLPDKPIIALLAGSRIQELKSVLPVMIDLIEDYPDFQFVLAGAPSMGDEDYEPFMLKHDVKIVYAQTYQLLFHAEAALVTSGTATLETAIINVPEVVLYRTGGGKFLYTVMKAVLKINFISLVNIIMDREVVKELIQHKMNGREIKAELDAILFDEQYRAKMLSDYAELNVKLGGTGASKRFADEIVRLLRD